MLPKSGVTSRVTWEDVTLPSSLLRAHAPDQIPPIASFSSTTGLCRSSPVPAGKWPFPTLSLQSLCRRLDPYPVMSPRCFCPFLPREQRPHAMEKAFGTRDNPCHATSTGAGFRGCSHSFTFRLPHSLGLQVAPTAEHYTQGGQAVYTTHSPDGYPFRDVVSLRVRYGQLTRRDLHPLDCSLVGCSVPPPAPRTGRAELPHPALLQNLRPSRSARLLDEWVSCTTQAFGRDRRRGIACTPYPHALLAASAIYADVVPCTAGPADRGASPGHG